MFRRIDPKQIESWNGGYKSHQDTCCVATKQSTTNLDAKSGESVAPLHPLKCFCPSHYQNRLLKPRWGCSKCNVYCNLKTNISFYSPVLCEAQKLILQKFEFNIIIWKFSNLFIYDLYIVLYFFFSEIIFILF